MDVSPPTPARACLWCGSALPASAERAIRCPACGRSNRREDLAVYHTLRPEARRLQTALEVAAALVLAGSFFASIVHWQHLKGGDPAVVFGVLTPAVVAIFLGYQTRYLTRRRPPRTLRPSPMSCGGALLAVAGYWTFLGLTQRDMEGATLYVVLALAAAVVAAMALRVWRAARSG